MGNSNVEKLPLQIDLVNTSHLNDTYSNLSVKNETFGRDEDLAKIEIIVQTVIFALAVIGNGLVLLILLCRQKKLSRMNLMIVHLSLADLFVAFFNVLPQLIWDITYRFEGDDILCRLVKFFQVVAMYASSYVLLCTALDRFLAICCPLRAHTWTTRHMQMTVLGAWIVSLVFSSPQMVIFAKREVELGSGVYDCWGIFNPEWTLQLYITWFTVAVYIFPSITLLVTYGNIYRVVRSSVQLKETSTRSYRSKDTNNGTLLSNNSSRRSRDQVLQPRAHVKGMSKAKVKTAKLTFTVIICYMLCWGPFCICQMWSVWDINAPFTSSVATVFLLLASLNSCTNPWIYLAFSDRACVHLMRFFPCLRKNQRAWRTSGTESRLRSTELTNADFSLTVMPGKLSESVDNL